MAAFPTRLMDAPTGAASGRRLWLFVGLWSGLLLAATAASVYFTHEASVTLSPTMIEVPPVAPLLVAGQVPRDKPLPLAPDNRVTEEATEGRLPIAAGGLLPRHVYAYPFNTKDTRPRIAVVLTDAGPQAAALSEALRALPGSVTIALSASTPKLGETLADIRAAGHETLLTVPMEGTDPTQYDPGPNALRRGLSSNENIHRLRQLLASGSGYVGLALDPAAGLLSNDLIGVDLLEESQRRGLLWLAPAEGMYSFADLGEKLKVPVFSEEVIRLDNVLTPSGLEAALLRLESLARLKGRAVAVTSPYPLVVEKLNDWLPSLGEKGIALAPLSALAPPPAGSLATPAAAIATAPAPHAVAEEEAHPAPAHETPADEETPPPSHSPAH